MILLTNSTFFLLEQQTETRLRGSRDSSELPPTPPDKLRDHL